MKTLPIDRDRHFQPSDYPRQPSAYTPLIHFGQQRREAERFVDGRVIESCIKNGDLRDNNDGCACFRKKWGDGVAYYLIAGFHEKGYRIAITIWPHLHDREAALSSGKWSSDELDEIEALNERHQERFEDKYPLYDSWLKYQYGTQP